MSKPFSGSPTPILLNSTGVIVSFPLDTEIDLLRSVHSLTPGTTFLRTSGGGGGGGGGAITPTGFNTPVGTPGQVAVNSTSTILFPPNTSRAYAHIINNSTSPIYIQYFVDAIFRQGFPVLPNGVLFISGFDLTYGQVSAISNVDGVLIDVLEAGY